MPTPLWKGSPQGRVRVLVTGVGGNVAQGVLKALRHSGLARRVVGTDANPMAAGLFMVDRGYVVPRADEPDFADCLIDILRREDIDLVFVGADAETIHLSRQRDRLEKETAARVLVAPFEVVENCHDKWRTAGWLEKIGVPHPLTARSDDLEGLEALAGRAGFPLIAKPRQGFASRDIYLINHYRELMPIAGKYGRDGIVQAYVGRPEDEYTAAAFSARPPDVDAVIVMRRELLQGTSYRIESVPDKSLTDAVRSWAVKMGVLGPCNIQFRLTGHGPVCFEVNARFSGTTGVRYLFGYNDVDMAIRSFIFGEKARQPLIEPGVVLRYWDELHIPDADFSILTRNKSIDPGEPR